MVVCVQAGGKAAAGLDPGGHCRRCLPCHRAGSWAHTVRVTEAHTRRGRNTRSGLRVSDHKILELIHVMERTV